MTRTHDGITRADTDPHGCLHGAEEWAKSFGPTGIVGLGKRIGGILRPIGRRNCLRESALIYLIIPLDFSRVGLSFCFLFAGNVEDRGASNLTREKLCVDLVDFGSPDCDLKHVRNLEPSIAYVKSDSCDFITHSKSWSDTHLLDDAPMKIRQQKSRRKWARVVGSYPLIAHNVDAS